MLFTTLLVSTLGYGNDAFICIKQFFTRSCHHPSLPTIRSCHTHGAEGRFLFTTCAGSGLVAVERYMGRKITDMYAVAYHENVIPLLDYLMTVSVLTQQTMWI